MKLEKKGFKYLLNELYRQGRILFRRRLLFQSVVCTQTSFWSSHHNLVITFFQLHLYAILNLTIYQIQGNKGFPLQLLFSKEREKKPKNTLVYYVEKLLSMA